MKFAEIEDYRKFTTPAELHKAVNTLRGMIGGISSDGDLSELEITELSHWCLLHANLRNRHPFSEIIPAVEKALEDGKIDPEESKNIVWLCGNFADDCSYYEIVTSSTQFLNGLVHGMMADGELSDKEIERLKYWLEENTYLEGTYPFDELYSITNSILADKKITAEERGTLSAFLGNLIEFKDSYNLNEYDFASLREKYSVQGICAMCPELSFEDKQFCFTGESYKATRAEIADKIVSLGGIFRTGVSTKTDYLIVGNAGNPCWAYSCYGRKIEEAIALRKKGAKLLIVNETYLWDGIDDFD